MSQTQNTLYIQHKKSWIIMINVVQHHVFQQMTQSRVSGTVLIQKNHTWLQLCAYSERTRVM